MALKYYPYHPDGNIVAANIYAVQVDENLMDLYDGIVKTFNNWTGVLNDAAGDVTGAATPVGYATLELLVAAFPAAELVPAGLTVRGLSLALDGIGNFFIPVLTNLYTVSPDDTDVIIDGGDFDATVKNYRLSEGVPENITPAQLDGGPFAYITGFRGESRQGLTNPG